MIIDEIIALFGTIFGLLLEGLSGLVVPVVNILIAAIELILGIFIEGFSLRRLNRYRRKNRGATRGRGTVFALAIAAIVVGAAIVYPLITEREITFVAKDGHPLPFATVVVYSGDDVERFRTNSVGEVSVPRFGVDKLQIKSARYVERTWNAAQITSTLVVQRTRLGAGLDKIAERLLKPADD
ncbi:MAG: hypothetical protein K0U93_02700 [Gammaproteobacteria bacterium]|nr:hypothetical protein [Gammaproteobacteria bacterium]